MSQFTVPADSSPPSTPGNRHLADHPSTTPAGPPPSTTGFSFTPQRPIPSSAASFTPTDPPPSSAFGSSRLHFPSSAAPSSPPANDVTSSRALFSFNDADIDEDNPLFSFGAGKGVNGTNVEESTIQEEDMEPESNAAFEGDEGEDFGRYGSFERLLATMVTPEKAQTASPSRRRTYQNIDGLKKDSLRFSTINEPVDSIVAPIARGIAANLAEPAVDETGELVIGTEAIIESLYQQQDGIEDPARLANDLSATTSKLIQLWDRSESDIRQDLFSEDGVPLSPDVLELGDCPALVSAISVAKCFLQLHHPPLAKPKSSIFGASSRFRSSFPSNESLERPISYPKMLSDWLNVSHNNLEPLLRDVNNTRPSSTTSPSFWDVVHSALLRGYLSEAIHTLKNADFSFGPPSAENDFDTVGYQGQALADIKRAVAQVIETLEKCPAHRTDDWNVRGNEWTLFRRQIETALFSLVLAAEGRDRDEEDQFSSSIIAPHFGMSTSQGGQMSLSQASRKAECKIPWAIYQSLRNIYGIMLGKSETILGLAQDWLEATVCLTIWWPGDTSQRSNKRLRLNQTTDDSETFFEDQADYLHQLSTAFAKVTDSSREISHEVRTVVPVEVLLGCVFEGRTEEVINVLKGWSLPIAAAVTEIAALGGWFPVDSTADAMDVFDEDDLMLLGTEPRRGALRRDDLLIAYAEALFKRPTIETDKEGWELAVHVLGRVQNEKRANEKLDALLDNIQLDSSERVDKLLMLCKSAGLVDQGQKVAERYANDLAHSTDKYGTVITYLARAHADRKVKGVLDLLISYSLIQSRAYPPVEEIDPHLKKMIDHPKKTLFELAKIDSECASIVSTYLSGYATIRKFYELRDASLSNAAQSESQARSAKRDALEALVAVINSSSDNIKGGIFDPESLAVVSVDGLVNLLGEALPLLRVSPSIATSNETTALLTAMVHLDMVAPLVRKQVEEHLSASLASHSAENQSSQSSLSPKASLRKSVSSLTMLSGSEFELVGSELLNSGMGASGVLVPEPSKGSKKVARGWDWRKGFSKNATIEDVFRVLRITLIDEVCQGWAANP